MSEDADERDYLVGAQPATHPWSFVEVVKEAFLLEYDCIQNQDIAEVLGVDKSRISQIFGNPKSLKAESINGMLDCIRSRAHKKRIVEAWVRECFGESFSEVSREPLLGEQVTEKTLRRVDRQLRESRLGTAAKTAFEAARKTEDPILRERLLDRAYFARQRLDEPGQAISIARLIALGAVKRGDMPRLAGAHLMRARVLRSLTDSSWDEVSPILDLAERLVEGYPAKDLKDTPYTTADESKVKSERTVALVTFAERGQMDLPQLFLSGLLQDCLDSVKAVRSYQEKSRLLQLASRVSLLLGNTFQALEFLERSFESGSVKNLNAYEMAGVLNARIVVKTESPEAARKYLLDVIAGCSRTMDFYHRRIAETDLARVESSMFPPTLPVA